MWGATASAWAMAVPDVLMAYLGVGSLRLSLVCRTLAVRCGRAHGFSIVLPSIRTVDVFSLQLSAPVLVLELARSPAEVRQVALDHGFWEDNIGVKWLLPSVEAWPVAVYLAHHGVWMAGARRMSNTPGRRLYLDDMRRRHLIMHDGSTSSNLMDSLDTIPGRLRVHILRCGIIEW